MDGPTLVDMLERCRIVHGKRIAIISDGFEITFEQLYNDSHAVASALIERGVQSGDHVAMWVPNVHFFHPIFFGIVLAGAVAVPMNTRYRVTEVDYILANSDSRYLFSVSRFLNFNYIQMLSVIAPGLEQLQEIVLCGEACSGDKVEPGKPYCSYGSLLGQGTNWRDDSQLKERKASVTGDNVALILYTSGTTGKPKGAQLTHRNVITNAEVTGCVMNVTDQDRYYVPLPLFHSFGLVLGSLTPLGFGASVVLQDVFDVRAGLKLMSEYGCTMNFGVPAMFIRELECIASSPGEFDLSSLRSGMMGGAPCPIEIVRGVIDVMGCNVCIGYGITETSPLLTLTRYDDPPEIRAKSVGKPLPGVQVKIVSKEGLELNVGETGEIYVRGNVMKGYYRLPEKTAEVIDGEGWYHTADLGHIDEEGYVYVTGRMKDMIIVGGFNVYPREIEEFLFTHAGVGDVAVVGGKDTKLGERVVAYIVPRAETILNSLDIIEYCKNNIANYKIPVHVEILDELPRTASGKVQKYILRERADSLLKG